MNRTNLSRLLIGIVLIWNIQCALAFLLWPGRYAPGFELAGSPGEAAVRGIGVLFMMWNVPYAVALWHPLRHRVSLFEATAMQSIGVVGESLILYYLPLSYTVLRSSISRFILFDILGLMALLLAVWITAPLRSRRKPMDDSPTV
jgi:hypothetical protein